MNRFSLSAAVGIATLLMLTCRGYAQDASDAGQNAIPQNAAPQRYQIEIILFANTNADPHSELFSIEQPAEAPAAAPLPLQPLPDGGDDGAELQIVPGTAPPTAAAQSASGQSAAGAQSGAAPQSPSTAPSAAGLQVIPDTPQDEAAAGNAAAGDASAGGTPANTPPQAFTFRLVKPNEMKLDAEYAKIERLDAYRPLGHAAWIQEGLPENQARPIDMAELGIANPSGTIQLHVSRYLHVSIDLTYRTQPQTAAAAAAADAPAAGGTQTAGNTPVGDAGTPADASSAADQPAGAQAGEDVGGLGPITVTPRYVMHQERRIRAGELQYFDHPMFGLLLLITPAPKKAPAQPANGNGALTPAA